MAQFSDQLLTSCDGRPSSGKILGSSMSVGLVAKKFWNKLVHMQQTIQKLQTEVRIIKKLAKFSLMCFQNHKYCSVRYIGKSWALRVKEWVST